MMWQSWQIGKLVRSSWFWRRPSLGFLVLAAIGNDGAFAQAKSLIPPPIPLKLTRVELAYTPAASAASNSPAASAAAKTAIGTRQDTIEIFEQPKALEGAVKSQKITNVISSTILSPDPKSDNTGTTSGSLTYEFKDQKAEQFSKPLEFEIDPNTIDDIIIDVSEADNDKSARIPVAYSLTAPDGTKIKADAVSPSKVRLTLQLNPDKKFVFLSVTLPIAEDKATVDVGTAGTPIKRIEITNGSPYDWSTSKGEVFHVSVKISGKSVFESPWSSSIERGFSLNLIANKTPPTTSISLTRVYLATTTTGATTGQLIYQENIDFNSADSLDLQVDPASFPGIRVGIWDAAMPDESSPVGWTLTSDLIDPSKLSATNPQKKVVTVNVKPVELKKWLHVRISVPIAANNSSVELAFAAKIGFVSTMVNDIKVTNGSSVDWKSKNAAGFRLSVQSVDRVVYDGENFPSLPSGSSRTVSQKLGTNVDAKTMFVDLNSLLDKAGKTIPANISRLPRLMRLDNGKQCEDGQRMPLDDITNIQLRWNDDLTASDSVRVFNSINLFATGRPFNSSTQSLPLGVNCPLGSNCADKLCCAATGTCAANGPKEKQPHIVFLQIGEDPRVGVISAGKVPLAPWLPLSFTDGKLTYLNAENWKFQLCTHDDYVCDSRSIQFIDTRVGYVAFGSPQLEKESNGSPSSLTYGPRSVSTFVLALMPSATVEDWVSVLNSLSPNLKAAITTMNHDYFNELAAFYCLDPHGKNNVTDPENIRAYLTGLQSQLQPAIDIADQYQKQKSMLANVNLTVETLNAELQQMTNSTRGDQFGREMLKISLEIERQKKSGYRLGSDLQKLSRDLIVAIDIAHSSEAVQVTASVNQRSPIARPFAIPQAPVPLPPQSPAPVILPQLNTKPTPPAPMEGDPN